MLQLAQHTALQQTKMKSIALLHLRCTFGNNLAHHSHCLLMLLAQAISQLSQLFTATQRFLLSVTHLLPQSFLAQA
jgi:hypothetical protein